MARRRLRRFRCPRRHAEALLLSALLMACLAYAVTATAAAAVADAADAADAAGYTPGLSAADADAGSEGGGDVVYLDVTLNGMASGLAAFSYRDNALWSSPSTLRRLGFALDEHANGAVRLNGLRGVVATYDAARQEARISAPLELLNTPVTVLNRPADTIPQTSVAPGALLNYDLYATVDRHGASGLSAFTELRAFGRFGVLDSTALASAGNASAPGRDALTRLDTTWSLSFPQRMLTLRVGDLLTDALAWTRSTRLGGIQLARDFSLQPYRVTAPLPEFLGSAALPSDIELYVNGMRRYSGQVPSGPFALTTIPNINGAGNAQIVLTDTLGRVTTMDFPLYDTRQLLQKGLADWSAELGVVRSDYGRRSFAYGHDAAASGTWRYGVSDGFTAQAHAETTRGLVQAGVGGALLLGQAGVVSASFARSRDGSRSGSQVSAGYDWRSDRFNIGLDASRTTGAFRDVAARYGGAAPRATARASLGWNAGALGSFSLGYLHLRYPDQDASRYASASWFRPFGRHLSLSVSANRNLADPDDFTLFAGATFVFGSTSLSAGAQSDRGRASVVADANSPPPGDGGFGWHAGVRAGDGQDGGRAEAEYLGSYGRADGGFYAYGDSGYAYARASGALVAMGGRVFAARHVDASFAVVSTDGIADVPVQLENRPIGRTDAHGMLLVTPLNAYQNNKLSIDPMNLPSSVRIDRVDTIATPPDRAGTLVRFGITPVRAASVIIVDAEGAPVPVGSHARLRGHTGDAVLVGFDGMAWFDALDADNIVDVDTGSAHCSVHFAYVADGEGVPQIGPLTCRVEETR